MQVTRRFEGTQQAGEEKERRYVWGNDKKVKVYPNRAEFINRAIATFLSLDCNVNAVWEAREENGDDENEPWLYIENIPFFFASYTYEVQVKKWSIIGTITATGTRSSTGMGYPGIDPINDIFNVRAKLYSADKKTGEDTIKFDLLFFGDAKTGWCLRFKPYDSTEVADAQFCFYNATQLCTGNPGAIIAGTSSNIKTGVRGKRNYKLAATIEVANGQIVRESAYRKTANDTDTTTILTTKSGRNSAFWYSCNQKLPLIPITCGLFQAKGCYQHIPGMRIPEAHKSTEESQTQFTTDGHTFINTCTESDSAGYINMGLIDVS